MDYKPFIYLYTGDLIKIDGKALCYRNLNDNCSVHSKLLYVSCILPLKFADIHIYFKKREYARNIRSNHEAVTN